MTADTALRNVIDMYSQLGHQVAAHATSATPLGAVTAVAVRAVPGVDEASITRETKPRTFETLSPTGDGAQRADEAQYELGYGPCVDAVETSHIFRSDDLAAETRWPGFGARASLIGMRSVLSLRLTQESPGAMAGLNLYSYSLNAFDDHAQNMAVLLATHAGITVTQLTAQAKVANLEVALTTSREIGVAMGVLMATHKLTRDEAFDLIRIASQRQHRKVRDIATEIADTGTLDLA
jgi:GAF domain-containing protein